MKRWAAVGLLCGWVLWLKAISGASDVGWDPVDGFESAAECRAQAQSRLRPAPKAGETVSTIFDGPGSGHRINQSADGKTIIVFVKCLPAEADPRPRSKE